MVEERKEQFSRFKQARRLRYVSQASRLPYPNLPVFQFSIIPVKSWTEWQIDAHAIKTAGVGDAANFFGHLRAGRRHDA